MVQEDWMDDDSDDPYADPDPEFDDAMASGLGHDGDAMIAVISFAVAALFYTWAAYHYWLGNMSSMSFSQMGGKGAMWAWLWPGFEAMAYTSVLATVACIFSAYRAFAEKSMAPQLGIGVVIISLPPVTYTLYLVTQGSRALGAMAGMFSTSIVEILLGIFIKMPFMKYPVGMLAAGVGAYYAHRAAQANFYDEM